MFSLGNSTISTIAATLAFLWFPKEPPNTLGTFSAPQPLPAPRPPNYSYYYNLHLFSSYFTFCYLRLPYVYRHAAPGVGGIPTLGGWGCGLGRWWGLEL